MNLDRHMLLSLSPSIFPSIFETSKTELCFPSKKRATSKFRGLNLSKICSMLHRL